MTVKKIIDSQDNHVIVLGNRDYGESHPALVSALMHCLSFLEVGDILEEEIRYKEIGDICFSKKIYLKAKVNKVKKEELQSLIREVYVGT